MFSRLHIVGCAAALTLAGSGWAQMTPGQSAPMGGPQSTGSVGMAQDPRGDLYNTDKDFIRSAAESSATEVHLGRLAQDRASSDAVKQLGKRMVAASAQTSEELQKAAAALKIQLPADPPRKAKKAKDKLVKLSGADFDLAYAKMAADEEKQVVRQFEREALSGMVPGVKEFASKNLPVERELERQAEDLAGAGTKTAK
jgi:putative membrane protein